MAMHRSLYLLVCSLWAATVWGDAPAEKTPVQIEKKADSVSLSMNGKTVWKFNHRASEGKPFFHPLATTDGKVLTDLRPDDHRWHRALWFSWKMINGVNYWEEDRKTGESDGRTTLLDVTRTVSPDQVVTLEMKLAYAPAQGDDVMTEKRVVKVHPPDAGGVYRMDWETVFTALGSDVVLDRTPPPGQPDGRDWGGYAGYSVRMAKPVGGGAFLNSEGVAGAKANRAKARWMSYSAPDGGGMLIMDHPSNLRHPVTWYLVESMPYFGPAVIHDAPHTIKAGRSLRLRYRLVVYPKAQDAVGAEKEWAAWIQ